MLSGIEVNFDGLVGPTHHYAGLGIGNQASLRNRNQISNPRAAALQGLNKMKALHDRGFVQGILPPHPRPNLRALRNIGFSGSDTQLIQQLASNPTLLSMFSSASAMWSASAATVAPSADTADHRVHFTVANLQSSLHRCQEPSLSERIFQTVFPDPQYFQHHKALINHNCFGDEGAANHHRICHHYTERGIELFTFGRQISGHSSIPCRYPARQTFEASQAVARLHQLDPELTLLVKQNPQLIDQGIFHNDLIAMSNQHLLICHQQAFMQQAALFEQLETLADRLAIPLIILEVAEAQISVELALESYLFNSQLLTQLDGSMVMLVPEECQRQEKVWIYLKELVEANEIPINEIMTINLEQSMRNGGGPASQRLRVVLTPQELAAVNQGCLFNEWRYQQLLYWIDRHYPDRLSTRDLADPDLITRTYQALDELTQILQLGSIYDFQR